MRYRLDVAYHGREFHGWQVQPGLRTVQGELESWLARLLGSPITLIGAGRTDAGVHAEFLPTHFNTPDRIDEQHLYQRLKAALPTDIAVLGLHAVSEHFHARYSAIERTYIYRVRLGFWPFGRDREWQVAGEVNIARLRECAKLILGSHDFSGFCLAQSQRENNQCNVRFAEWAIDGNACIFTVRADRFLHQMVRLLVGTSVEAARGRWTAERISDILRTKDVRLCGGAAPPHGLTLVRVDYPDGVGRPADFD